MALGLSITALLAWIDFRTRKIPNALVLPALLAALFIYSHPLPAAAMFCLMAIIYQRGQIGGGDVKLFVLLAACIGWWALMVLGMTISFIQLCRSMGHHRGLPVAPFALLSVLCTSGILQAWGLR